MDSFGGTRADCPGVLRHITCLEVWVLTLAQIRQRAQQTKRVRMERLKAEMLEKERRVDRENHIQSVRMIAPRSESA